MKVEQHINAIIEAHKEDIIAFCEDIYRHGERGFHEVRTAEKFKEFLNKLQIETEEGLAITGVKGTIGKLEGPNVTLIGELDGIYCSAHPFANQETGISHTCGHHVQLGAVLGAAIALSSPDVVSHLDGSVTFFGTPAEEYIDSKTKEELASTGKVTYSSSGKCELIYLGMFDHADVIMTHHVHTESDGKADVLVGLNSSNGFVSKKIIVKGTASHAASSPHKGVNALNAAMLGLNAVAFLRETFKDEDRIRIHANITEGGNVVNVVPDHVVIEAMVRGKTITAMEDACVKVDRAFEGAAYALGATVEIKSSPGYLPTIAREPDIALEQAVASLADELIIECTDLSRHNAYSTDVGDLTHLYPVINFTTGGIKGDLHSANFEVVDPYKAYVIPAKLMALTAYHLLKNGAENIAEIKEEFEAKLTKEQWEDWKQGK